MSISHDRALEAAQAFIDGHFKNPDRRYPRVCIPASLDDDDLVLTTYITEQRARTATLEAELLQAREWQKAAELEATRQGQRNLKLRTTGNNLSAVAAVLAGHVPSPGNHSFLARQMSRVLDTWKAARDAWDSAALSVED